MDKITLVLIMVGSIVIGGGLGVLIAYILNKRKAKEIENEPNVID